jgi:acylphosphatase
MVQGVGYRYFAIARAEALELVGYVRNVPNGDVEVVAEGEQENLKTFIEALKQGPRSAVVQNVVVVWLPATGEFKDFRVRWY